MNFVICMGLFISFPSRKDSIIQSALEKKQPIDIESSGSLGLHYGGKCHQTFPNETISSEERVEWCSNIAKGDDKAWISYHIKDSQVKLTGFSLRNGCCHYACCCVDDNTDLDVCCCDLYSFSLQGSNDNLTWKTIYKVDKEKYFYYCLFKTYEFPTTEPFAFLRIIQDEEYPGCPRCMQINQVEFYGEVLTGKSFIESIEDGDESVSIIGKVKRSNDE